MNRTFFNRMLMYSFCFLLILGWSYQNADAQTGAEKHAGQRSSMDQFRGKDINEIYEQKGSFKASLFNDEIEVVFDTNIGFMAMATMVSMHARNDDGQCNLHFLNVKESLKPGTYDVKPQNGIRVAAVCFIEDTDKPERIVSDAGIITILEITANKTLKGLFDFSMKGVTTDRRYKFSGEFVAPPDS